MRDRDDRPLEILQVRLKPRDALRVEVVRRLVEQQQVVPLEQQPRERDATPLAAREHGRRRVARRASQRLHRAVDHAVELPEISGVDGLLRPLELRERALHLLGTQILRELRAQALKLGENLAAARDAGVDRLADGLADELRLLRQVADRSPRRRRRRSVERRVDTRHDLEQC